MKNPKLFLLLILLPITVFAGNKTISLNGIWEIAEGDLLCPPVVYEHKVPVPGLVKLASPEFPDVGTLKSKMHRQAFLYRKTFTINSDIPARAILKIAKAKYGVKVFINC